MELEKAWVITSGDEDSYTVLMQGVALSEQSAENFAEQCRRQISSCYRQPEPWSCTAKNDGSTRTWRSKRDYVRIEVTDLV